MSSPRRVWCIVRRPGRYWDSEGKSTRANFFCNQAQNIQCKPVASITISCLWILAWQLFDLHYDYYTNKLYKLRRVRQKLGSPVSVFVLPGKISLRGTDRRWYPDLFLALKKLMGDNWESKAEREGCWTFFSDLYLLIRCSAPTQGRFSMNSEHL